MSVILLSLLNQSTCWSYCIISENDGANSSCITLNEFARSAYNLHPEVALVFQPGKHTLSVEISVFNISEFRISTLQSVNTTIILCENQARLVVNKVRNVSISDTMLLGCGENLFIAVDNLLIDNSTFTGSEESLTALVFYDIKSALITRTDFSSNHKSRYEDGSTILVSRSSTVSIDYCDFYNNSDQFGAVYVDMESTMTITNCDFVHNRGGIIFANSSSIFISSSTFSNNVNMFTSMLITILFSNAEIVMTNFTNNSQVLAAFHTDITLNQCIFNYNFVPSYINTRSQDADYNGIVYLYSVYTVMIMCSFFANKAELGGIVVIDQSIFVSDTQLNISYNQALKGAFIVIRSSAEFLGNTTFMNNNGSLSCLVSKVIFHGPGNVVFQGNTPSSRDNDTIRGGAITAYYGYILFTQSSSVTLINNYALNGAGMCTVGSVIHIASHMNITGNEAKEFGGGVFSYRSNIQVTFDINIDNNKAKLGGGIYGLNSYISVTTGSEDSTFHNLSLTNNEAILGGGLYLSSNAFLYVYHLDRRPHAINVILSSNRADYGGAIYFRDETNKFLCESDSADEFSAVIECFFQVVNLYNETGSLRFHFDHNRATKAGPVLYGGLLDRCAATRLTSFSFFDSNFGQALSNLSGIDYFKRVSNIANLESIASDPVKLCFCFENKPNCSVPRLPIKTKKGSIFSVSVSAFDHVDHPLNAIIYTQLQSITGGLGEGQQSQEIDAQCTNLSISVTSLADNETVLLHADGPCGNASQSTRIIDIEFTECDCPVGFDIDFQQQSSCECKCSEDKQVRDLIHNCTIKNQHFKKVNNYWIGYENTTDSTGFILSLTCPFDYCLSFRSAKINLNIPDGSDEQCANNRRGRLCGSCKSQYSLSLGQSGCVKCGYLWPLNTTFIVLSFTLMGVILVVLILFLNITITTGTINGVIFSANILSVILYSFPEQNYSTFYHFII